MTDVIPVVSVVLAARDEASSIAQAVESILAQTLREWELVVVDDGSEDETPRVVESFDDARIRLIRTPPGGLPAALNRGIAEARASLVARQDADDYSLPERLQRQVAFLGERGDVALVGSAWREVDRDGRTLTPRAPVVTGPLNDVLTCFNPVAHTTATFRREAVEVLGGYDESFPYAADYDLWLRLACAGATLWNLDETLAVRVMTGTNMSAENERGRLREELRIRVRDIRRRRRAGRSVGGQLKQLAVRASGLLAPIALRRTVRRRRGKAP